MSGQEAKRLQVVVVDEEFPYPTNSGKRIRTLNLVKQLSKIHDIIYVAQNNHDADELKTATEYMNSLGIETIGVPRSIPEKAGIGFYGRLFANLFSPLPYSVSSHFNPALLNEINRLKAERQIDVWHCEWTPYAEYFRKVDVKPLVVAAHNVESLIWKRYVESESNWLKRWYIRQQWKKFERFEKWAFGRADRTIAVSCQDAQLAKESFGAQKVDVVENGVDFEGFSSNGQARSENEMLFLGSLDWRPNLDGLQHFLKTAFPEVVTKHPDVVLSIVGRNAPDWLLSLGKTNPNVRVYSNVPDVQPYLSRATLLVVPLRIGGGSRLKIIEAAANGLPVVSTKVGAEGLNFDSESEFYQADAVEELDSLLIKALSEPDQRISRASRARVKAERDYEWRVLANVQDKIWQDVTKLTKGDH